MYLEPENRDYRKIFNFIIRFFGESNGVLFQHKQKQHFLNKEDNIMLGPILSIVGHAVVDVIVTVITRK